LPVFWRHIFLAEEKHIVCLKPVRWLLGAALKQEEFIEDEKHAMMMIENCDNAQHRVRMRNAAILWIRNYCSVMRKLEN
jgi:hypothetical protein